MPKGDTFKFTNVESPKAFLDFFFAGKLRRLEDGHIYSDEFCGNLQTWMSDHLSGLEVLETETDIDPATGQYVTKVVGTRPRFSCQVVRLAPEKKPISEVVQKGK